MPVKCEEPIDELTVQVWLLFDNPNFKRCMPIIFMTHLSFSVILSSHTGI